MGKRRERGKLECKRRQEGRKERRKSVCDERERERETRV